MGEKEELEAIEQQLKGLVECGLCDAHENGKFSLTEAGKDYVETVLLAGVEERGHIYALGRLQGLREAEQMDSD